MKEICFESIELNSSTNLRKHINSLGTLKLVVICYNLRLYWDSLRKILQGNGYICFQ